MNEYFTPDVFELNVLSEAFCNPKDIPFEAYDRHIKFLLTDAKYRKGKLIHFFPRVDSANDKIKGGYKFVFHLTLNWYSQLKLSRMIVFITYLSTY